MESAARKSCGGDRSKAVRKEKGMRERKRRETVNVKRKTQREVVRDALLCAARLEVCMTLGELSRKTKYPEASISAQLRHLRKLRNGGYVVETRHREVEEVNRESKHEKVWEYRMRYGVWVRRVGRRWRDVSSAKYLNGG